MERHVAVVGAGLTGLGVALAFARRGHRVTLLEADASLPPATPERAFDEWKRPGVGQFQATHGFVALGRNVLRDSAPDVLAGLFAAGAAPVDFTRLFEAGDTSEGDADLVGIACRRAVFEHVLREAVVAEPGVALRPGLRAIGLICNSEGAEPAITGVRLAGSAQDLPADLVVDAGGRRSAVPEWWSSCTGASITEDREGCGLVYYGRYFRARPGAELPDGRWYFGPLGDLGFIGYVIHVADNRVFTITFNTPGWDRDFRALRFADAFMAAAAAIPALAPWIDEGLAEPISGVVSFGGLTNSVRSFAMPGGRLPGGLVFVGDSRCHTNPAQGWGASIGIAQAFDLARLVDEVGDCGAQLVADHESREGPRGRAVYDAVAGADRLRVANWRQEPPPADAATAAAVELKALFQPAAMRDAVVLRALLRRNNLLSEPGALLRDPDLRARAMAAIGDTVPGPVAAAGPSRSELLATLAR